jgi:hypothetical protein
MNWLKNKGQKLWEFFFIGTKNKIIFEIFIVTKNLFNFILYDHISCCYYFFKIPNIFQNIDLTLKKSPPNFFIVSVFAFSSPLWICKFVFVPINFLAFGCEILGTFLAFTCYTTIIKLHMIARIHKLDIECRWRKDVKTKCW